MSFRFLFVPGCVRLIYRKGLTASGVMHNLDLDASLFTVILETSRSFDSSVVGEGLLLLQYCSWDFVKIDIRK